MNIRGLFTPKLGDIVVVTSNNCGHYYQIGSRYKICNQNSPDSWLLDNADGTPFQGNRNWINSLDFDIDDFDRDNLIDDLSNILEFIKDYPDLKTSIAKIEKEYKVFRILKEIKSGKSDFDKISIISKYI